MQRYRVEIIQDIKFPQDYDFLVSPTGEICRRLSYRKAIGHAWVEADEGSIAWGILHDLVKEYGHCLHGYVYEPDLEKEKEEEIAFANQVKEASKVPPHPPVNTHPSPKFFLHPIHSIGSDGKRRAWIGCKWVVVS